MNMFTYFSVVAAALVVVSHAAESVEGPKKCKVLGGEGSYSYDPTTENGPQKWGEQKDFHMCKDGHSQSPINIPMPSKIAPMSDGPEPMMVTGKVKFSSGSYNWAVNCYEPGTCGHTMFGGKQFNVIGIHMHSPSEHVLNGTRYPLEAHIVHASDDGQLAVIATMFKYPDQSSYSAGVHEMIPKEWGTNRMVAKIMYAMKEDKESFHLNLGQIINAHAGYCSYTGSLTTPPCSEGVTFFMALHTETVTKRQVAAYKMSCGAGHDGNNRPLMPTNGREVTCYC